MSNYFTKQTFGVQAKNKAQQEVTKLMSKYDCLLLENKESVLKMIGEIRELVEAINQEYKRCGPIDVATYYSQRKDGDIQVANHIDVGYLCHIYIYPVKNTYK